MTNWRIGESSNVWANLVAAPINLAIAALEFVVWGSVWFFVAILSVNF
jgi:hypothetical protein